LPPARLHRVGQLRKSLRVDNRDKRHLATGEVQFLRLTEVPPPVRETPPSQACRFQLYVGEGVATALRYLCPNPMNHARKSKNSQFGTGSELYRLYRIRYMLGSNDRLDKGSG